MQRFLRTTVGIVLSALLCTQTLAYADQDLPDIGTTAAGTLTIDKELEYGDAYMRILRASSPIISDPVMDEYIGNLGHQLVAHANNVKTPFHFHLIRDRSVNAFAFFGGYVVANTGLFLHANNESELASVFAHEISHITQRHLARHMEAQARNTPLTIAALVGSLLLAIASPEAGIAALNATTAGSMQASINYTRSNEQEADRFGIATLARAGFNPKGMPDFFGHLADQYRYASTPPPMLLSHPLPAARLTEARDRANNYPRVSLPVSLNFHLAQARVIARYANIDSDRSLDWFARHLKKSSPILKPTIEYGEALVYIDTGKVAKAEAIMKRLLANDPYNNFYLDAASDLYSKKKEYNTALNLLQKALQRKPNNAVLTINYANILMEAQRSKEAIPILQRYTHSNPDDTVGWSLLADANASISNEKEQLAAQAELFALRADWNKAIKNYTRASQMATLGSLEQARYDARIDQLRFSQQRFAALK
ncbi:beta-barrel assembly-enhancing protease [Vibrio algicola]|uniref:Putative beta-barrel assembly-enhancing protease n=1 Tax=Vibrio algicola TaxID=2662262 RepID=A0A5Q0TF68_9VIBR|nr:M48 family metalloprotease [Vibrio algicola]